MEEKRIQNPAPPRGGRVGHPKGQRPKKQRQYRRIDVLKWYHPVVRNCQQKKSAIGLAASLNLGNVCGLIP
jgi:hypothetical protein